MPDAAHPPLSPAQLAEAQVGVSYNQFVPQDIIDELISEISAAGVSVHSARRQEGPKASIGWMLASPLVIWLLDKFFGEFIAESAKERYPALKRALLKISHRVIGPGREIRLLEITSSSSPLKDPFPEVEILSLCTTLKSGRRVKFCFDNELAGAQMEASLDALHALLEEHHRSYPADALSGRIAEAGVDIFHMVVMRFDRQTGIWWPWDPRPDHLKPSHPAR